MNVIRRNQGGRVPGPRLLVITTILVLVVGAHACSRSSSAPEATPTTPPPTATPTPSPTPVNPTVVLRESGRVMENLKSFHFRLRHRSGTTPFGPFMLDEADGDVVSPDKLSVDFDGTLGQFAFKSGLIALGGDTYMFNQLSQRWDEFPAEVNPLGFFNPREGIAAMMSRVDQVSLVPNGPDVYRIKGRLPAEALAPLLGATVKGSTIAVELAIDSSDLYLLEAILDGRVTPGEADGVIRVVTLSRFNEPTTIEAPQ